MQKEAIVAEGNENATELTGEHATLTQTLSLKSVVGKYVQFLILTTFVNFCMNVETLNDEIPSTIIFI